MKRYCIDYLGYPDRVVGHEHFEAANDASAVQIASDTMRSPWGKGQEIWHDDRLVHREIYK